MTKVLSKKTLSKLHIVIFALVFGILGIYTLWQTFAAPVDNQLVCTVTQPDMTMKLPDVSQILADKSEIGGTNQDIQNTVKASRKPGSKLKERIKERKKRLIKLAYVDPEAATKQVLAQQTTDKVAANSSCFEKPVTLQGDLEIRVADYFKEGKDSELYLLHIDRAKQPLVLHYNPKIAFTTGTRVKVTGYQVDQEVIVALSPDNMPSVSLAPVQAATTATGPQQTAVIMVNFQGTAQSAFSKTTADEVVFNGVNKYFQENSYGKISVVGSTFGWYQLSIAATCNTSQVQQEAITAANTDINYLNYSHIIIVAPFGAVCGWAGESTLGAYDVGTPDGTVKLATNWIDTAYLGNAPQSQAILQIFGHEYGHSLGLGHAQLYDCSAVSISLTGSGCTTVLYGDSYDIMGISQTGHLNAPHEDYMGWFNSGNLQTVTSSGTYNLEPIETNTNNLKVLRIPRGSGPIYDYIEYRQQPIATNTSTNYSTDTDVFLGGLIHANLYYQSTVSYLLDATPPARWNTTSLQSGNSFTDPASGTKVTVIGRTPAALTVSVQLGKIDFTAPTVSLTAPTNGSTVSGQVTVSASASDTSGISRVEFKRTGDAAPFATSFTPPYQGIWDTSKVANGSHNISAKAYDKAGEPYGISNNFTNTFPIQVSVLNNTNADTTKPSAPSNFTATAIAYNQVRLSWTAATDNVGVAGYYIVRNGAYLKSIPAPAGIGTVTYTDATVTGNTNYSYTVYAYDVANNFGGNSNVVYLSTPKIPDTQVPTWPAGSVPLVATTVSASQINLSWAAASDNIGVVGYDIYRGGVKVASNVTSTSWSENGLAAITNYSYYVVARDIAGNSSLNSNTATAKTQAPPVTTGTIAGTTYTNGLVKLPNVQIAIVYNGARHYYASNSSSRYILADIPPKNYPMITFTKTGYYTTYANVTVNAGQIVVKNVTLNKR